MILGIIKAIFKIVKKPAIPWKVNTIITENAHILCNSPNRYDSGTILGNSKAETNNTFDIIVKSLMLYFISTDILVLQMNVGNDTLQI